jgi:hypothetical protein
MIPFLVKEESSSMIAESVLVFTRVERWLLDDTK